MSIRKKRKNLIRKSFKKHVNRGVLSRSRQHAPAILCRRVAAMRGDSLVRMVKNWFYGTCKNGKFSKNVNPKKTQKFNPEIIFITR